MVGAQHWSVRARGSARPDAVKFPPLRWPCADCSLHHSRRLIQVTRAVLLGITEKVFRQDAFGDLAGALEPLRPSRGEEPMHKPAHA
jgi:hypothetical protein